MLLLRKIRYKWIRCALPHFVRHFYIFLQSADNISVQIENMPFCTMEHVFTVRIRVSMWIPLQQTTKKLKSIVYPPIVRFSQKKSRNS